jgi:RNA polymerase sigma-70 factor (ECF subfamily)
LKHLEPLQRVLESYCQRSLRDGNAVADVLQAAIARSFRDFHEFEEGTSFRAWIFRYVSLEILNCNRAAGRMEPQGQLTEVPANPDTSDLTGDESIAMLVLHCPERYIESCDWQVAEAMRNMPALERNILLLRAIGEFRYREIAEILNVPMGTVMGLLSRGRSRLRTQLADYARAERMHRSRDD